MDYLPFFITFALCFVGVVGTCNPSNYRKCFKQFINITDLTNGTGVASGTKLDSICSSYINFTSCYKPSDLKDCNKTITNYVKHQIELYNYSCGVGRKDINNSADCINKENSQLQSCIAQTDTQTNTCGIVQVMTKCSTQILSSSCGSQVSNVFKTLITKFYLSSSSVDSCSNTNGKAGGPQDTAPSPTRQPNQNNHSSTRQVSMLVLFIGLRSSMNFEF